MAHSVNSTGKNVSTARYSCFADLRLIGEWQEEAGFAIDMSVEFRVLSDCLVMAA
ncbi:SymE family type I addiction module toxin [Pantoea septica]|uniref:SymE family type I addiction module toxin n=1 Tax=Pantoea septica TaxID=472695 RepID=UPI000E88BD31|nr:type I toxin-antitoxin system SymE family toxin [Pantoea septica]HAT23042.1 hypothetical protein [Pantoea septica]